MKRLSSLVKIDSPDGKYLKYYSGASSNTRIRNFECTNASFYCKIFEARKDHNSDLFDNPGLTDSAVLWTQPADSILLAVKMRLDIQFVAAGLTDIDVTVGDGGNNTGILNPAAMNGVTDGVGTEYKDRGVYWNTIGGYYYGINKNWTGYTTAVGANLNTTSAGQVTLYFFYLEI